MGRSGENKLDSKYLDVVVRVDGKIAKRFKIRVREPRVKAGIRSVDAPDGLKPGVKGELKVVVADDGSELEEYVAQLCLMDGETRVIECRDVSLARNTTREEVFMVEAGAYNLRLKGPTGEVFDEKNVHVSKIPIEALVDLVEASLLYPDGGLLVFNVYEKDNAVIKSVDGVLEASVPLEYSLEKQRTERGGFKLAYRIKGFAEYMDKVEFKLTLSIRDAYDDEYVLKERYTVDVNVSDKYIGELEKSIEHYYQAAEDALAKENLPDALVYAAKAVVTCKKNSRFVRCEKYIGFFNEMTRNKPLIKKCSHLYSALENARRNGDKEVYEYLQDELRRVEEELSEVRSRLAEKLENAMGLIRDRKLGEAHKLLEDLRRECASMGYRQEYSSIIDECLRVENMVDIIRLYREMLSRDIRVEVPRRSRMRSFKINVVARNTLDEEVDNVYIDFSPAKHYLELPEDRVVLPPLYPGMEIAREVRAKSLFIGTIVIPYKVCLGDLCIDKKAKISIGRGIGVEEERHRLISDASILVGKSVMDLESLNITPRVPQRLTREIVFEDYRCSYILGSGGFSVTLLCSKQGVNVVLKIPPEAYYLLLAGSRVDQATLELNKHLLKAFDKEARVLHELKHPNIVKLLNYSLEPFPHLVFEYCEIGDLRRITMNTPRLKPKLALEIMIPITAAVAYAHSRDKPIIHMDIKPENILLTRDYVPKLTDFNISRILGTVSKTSAARGYTQGYAAPEQLGIPGYPPPGTYTDVFGLATVLYELITGIKPYPIEVYQNNFRTPHKPKPPSQLNPETPRELDEILEIALQTNPDDRYTDAAQLLRDLWDTYQQYYYG